MIILLKYTIMGGYVYFTDEKSLCYLSESVRKKACILVNSFVKSKV